ncbi:hypothetical protein BGZ51_001362 [Haplosporangium sp. Z 767]|nr:hypothetical protein BGZ50_002679 [Haplosporangium sp. Z 11]KAF9194018.1 hypothetical protein BGZ51_001362 [Haplosporangium sp. Z 767]
MTVDSHSQSFQVAGVLSSASVINIECLFDQETGKRFVLWKDIQLAIRNAQYIKHGETIVPFMRDSHHYDDIIPLRIEYRPGVVLTVVRKDQGHERNDSSVTSIQLPLLPAMSYINHFNAPNIHTLLNISSATHLQCNQIDLFGQQPIPSMEMATQTQNSFQSYKQLHHLYLQAIMAGQAAQAEGIKHAMKEHFNKLQAEMDKNRALQETIHQMQQQMLDMQKQALDRLAIIQNRVHAFVTQNYELHEYPIPRLFIVLPKASRRRDKVVKPFAKQFRLFFLCECGAHTMTEGTEDSHKIHLARHEGYDVDQPTAFFEKYRSYVLLMMQMIKFGVSVAGLVESPLAMSKVVLKSLDYASKNLKDLADQTISCIQERQINPDDATQDPDDGCKLEWQEALEGADLRQLESYLKIKDKGHALGNLYRIVTHEGHVKWVCIDHYRKSYGGLAIKRLREIVDANGGLFEQERGNITIVLASKTAALQFYDVLDRACGVLELSIKLDWDVTMDDLRTFETAMTKANIVHLTLNGRSFKGPRLDLVNRGRRFEPIVQLMSNGRIQAMKLQGIVDLYSRIGNPSKPGVSRLRTLSLGRWDFWSVTDIFAFKKILRHCGSLVELAVITHYPSVLLAIVTDPTLGLSRLKTVSIHTNVCNIVVDLIQGEIRTVVATMYLQAGPRSHVDTFIFNGHLTRLCLEADAFDSWKLSDIIEGNPRLLEIEAAGALKNYNDVINRVIKGREKIRDKAQGLSPCQLVLRPDPRKVNDQDDIGIVVLMVIKFENEVDVTVATMNVQMDVMNPVSHVGQSALKILLKRYGWSIETLVTNRHFKDDHARSLLRAINNQGSKLTSLVLNPVSLTTHGVRHMIKAIDRSPVASLSFDLCELHNSEQLEQALILLERYGQRMSKLNLSGFLLSESWMKALADRLPSRHLWPNLVTFGLSGRSYEWGTTTNRSSTSVVTWITSMLSSATKPRRPDEETLSDSANPTRVWTSLKEIRLEDWSPPSRTDWDLIIEAIDFSSLEVLSIEGTTFGERELKLLVGCLPVNGTEVPLRTFRITHTGLTYLNQSDDLWKQLRERAPHVDIHDRRLSWQKGLNILSISQYIFPQV